VNDQTVELILSWKHGGALVERSDGKPPEVADIIAVGQSLNEHGLPTKPIRLQWRKDAPPPHRR